VISWGTGGLIGGIITAVILAVVAIYRAKPQKDIDVVSKTKIEEEVKRLQTAHDRRRTIRLLRLEHYVDADIQYHRENRVYQEKLVGLVERCISAGLLPDGTTLGLPPEPPELPDIVPGDDLE
jgi:hypothetical protein